MEKHLMVAEASLKIEAVLGKTNREKVHRKRKKQFEMYTRKKQNKNNKEKEYENYKRKSGLYQKKKTE